MNTAFADGHAEFFAFPQEYEANATNVQDTPDPQANGFW